MYIINWYFYNLVTLKLTAYDKSNLKKQNTILQSQDFSVVIGALVHDTYTSIWFLTQ